MSSLDASSWGVDMDILWIYCAQQHFTCQILSFLFTCSDASAPRAVLLRQRQFKWKRQVHQQATLIKYVTRRASVQFCNSTPHQDPVKPEMLIPQRLYFTWHWAVPTFFGICHSTTQPDLHSPSKMSSGLLKGAVSSFIIISKTNRPGGEQTFTHKELPLRCGLTFGYLPHLEKYIPPNVLR